MQVQALEQEQQEKLEHVQRLENSTKEELWSEDLDGFQAAYEQWLEDEAKIAAELKSAQLKAKARNTKKGVSRACLLMLSC